MLKDVTLGQYYPVDSVLHRLDPRTKLAGTLIYIVALFCCDNWQSYALATLFLAVSIGLSRVPLSYMLRGLKGILFILLISVSFNLFLTDGKVLWQWKFIKITEEGLVLAGFMALRLVYLVVGSTIMTLTTTPNALTQGMEKGLGFLKVFRVPVHEIAMM
ncbi:MAG: energy-coupling factor transporter transmembrane component T family protein, partial [Stomatobaculum longum]